MRIFIAGVTGVIGRRAAKRLIADGHSIVGLSRSQENTELISCLGAEPRLGDIFNLKEMITLSSDCDAIVHLATAIPTDVRTTVKDWFLNDRIRREGTTNLVEAALRNGCKLYIQQSITMIYGDREGEWVSEANHIANSQPTILQSAFDMEQIVKDAMNQRKLPAIILRFGTFYSHESAHTRIMFESTQTRLLPIMGSGGTFWNLVHLDDAARALQLTVKGHEHGVQQIFNVCDNEPVTSRTLMNSVADLLHAQRPRHIPAFCAKLVMGNHAVEPLLMSARCKNDLMKKQIAWEPQYRNHREGFRVEVEKWLASRGSQHA